jgi:perosamine synthetase
MISMAAKDGWGDNHNKYVDLFELEFANYLGVKHAIATSSCTGAITLGLSALGIGSGDEVLVPDTNWIANVSPIVHLGGVPIFIDIDPVSWCIDPDLIESKITERTKAVMAVHLYGNVCALEALQEICARRNLVLIEDAAEALGGSFDGRKLGSIGRIGVFSFHGSKTMTTGEGGMLVTNDDELAASVRILNSHGRNPMVSKQFWSEHIGYKFKMSNLAAALGLAQLRRIDELLEKKRYILDFYRDRLLDSSHIAMNPIQEKCESGAWMPTIVFSSKSGITREQLQLKFSQSNIDARVFFWPISSMPPFQSVSENTNAYDLPGRAMNLPSYHDLSDKEMERVISVILESLGEAVILPRKKT